MAADDNQPMSTLISPSPLPGSRSDEPSQAEVRPQGGACRLQDWGLILATGPDSASFLHGQLTQDMLSLGDTQARLAGYCSAKGRLLATFTAWRTGSEQIALACSADLLAPTLKRLAMFVLRAKCKLTPGEADLALFGLSGSSAEAWLVAASGGPLPTQPWSVRSWGTAGEMKAIRLPSAAEGGLTVGSRGGAPGSRWLLAQPAQMPSPPLPELPRAEWNWLEVRSGVARVVAATVEQFVPQMVNLELTGGVNFQKGCYPGQEVVARSQYRGTLKRRMFLMTADGPLQAGQEVHHSSDPDQPAGLVALAAPVPGNTTGRYAALVECKSALVATPGILSAGAVRLQPDNLPYALPLEPA